MSDKEQAFRDFQMLAARARGWLALMDELKDVDSLHDAAAQAGDRLKNTLKRQNEAEAKVAELEKKIADKEVEVGVALSAELTRQERAHKEQLDADAVSAKMKASNIINDAEKEAGKLLSTHSDTLHAIGVAKSELEALKAQITERRFEHEGLVEKVARENTLLADAKAEIETLRKTLGLGKSGE